MASEKIIDGKAFATALRGRIATGVAAFKAQTGRAPGLAVVLVGEDPASAVYVRSKGKACREVGIEWCVVVHAPQYDGRCWAPLLARGAVVATVCTHAG